MREEFDFDVALAALQDGQGLTGKDGILTPLVKQLTEAALQAELEAHFGICQTSCPLISCGVSDFRGAVFVFGVEPDWSSRLPVSGFA